MCSCDCLFCFKQACWYINILYSFIAREASDSFKEVQVVSRLALEICVITLTSVLDNKDFLVMLNSLSFIYFYKQERA